VNLDTKEASLLRLYHKPIFGSDVYVIEQDLLVPEFLAVFSCIFLQMGEA
jgi:hypothetical protein